MTLYELGYPIGAFLTVVRRNGAKNALDDNYKIDYFTCTSDGILLKNDIDL